MDIDAIITSTVSVIIFLAESFVLFFIGKLVYQLLHRNINVRDELVEKDNLAFAISHTGYFIGLTLAIGGALIGPSEGIVADLLAVGLYGMLAIVLLNISLFINDKIILSKFSTRDEIVRDQNAGTGAVEAASGIATGLIVMGSVYGEGGGLVTAIAFWLIGQALLIASAKIYNALLPYNLHEHLEKDNVAVGVGFAGALIAIANLIRHAIMHDFVSWTDSLLDVSLDFAIGILFLPLARFLADKILLPGRNLTDELVNQEKPNVGAG
ncbi:MAG: hypothetical protein RIS47_983, partial [Bacteroidota bacterium]